MTTCFISILSAEVEKYSHDYWKPTAIHFADGDPMPFNNDSKIISSCIEQRAGKIIKGVFEPLGYIVDLPSSQTVYPDYTLTHRETKERVAVDIKTTYLKSSMKLTLGSYPALKECISDSNTKKIQYPYESYSQHLVFGIVYSREHDGFTFADYFIRPKHELCDVVDGSGNTKNIGSIRAKNVDEFKHKKGPFMSFGTNAKSACDHYWSNRSTLYSNVKKPDQLVDYEYFSNLNNVITNTL